MVVHQRGVATGRVQRQASRRPLASLLCTFAPVTEHPVEDVKRAVPGAKKMFLGLYPQSGPHNSLVQFALHHRHWAESFDLVVHGAARSRNNILHIGNTTRERTSAVWMYMGSSRLVLGAKNRPCS